MKLLVKLKEVRFGLKFLLKTSSTSFGTDRIEEQWGSQWLNLYFFKEDSAHCTSTV